MRELATLLDRAREDVGAGKTHLTKFMDFQGGEGVINTLTQGHQDAYRALDDWLGKLGDPTLSTVSGAVTGAAPTTSARTTVRPRTWIRPIPRRT